MNDDEPMDALDRFEQALSDEANASYVLRLYIAGYTTRSAEAIENIRQICETNLKGRYTLEVVDIHQQPELARENQIIAVPTLIKALPLPLRRMIGDLSVEERILVGLNLETAGDPPENKQAGPDEKRQPGFRFL